MLINSAIPFVGHSHVDMLIYELRSIQRFDVIYLDNGDKVILSH